MSIAFTAEQVHQYLRQRELIGANWITLESVDDYQREWHPERLSGFYQCFNQGYTPPPGWRWGWVEGVRGIVLRSLESDAFIKRTDIEKWKPHRGKK